MEITSEGCQGIARFQLHRDASCLQVFFVLQGKARKEIHVILTEILAFFLPGRAKNLSAPLYVFVAVIFSLCYLLGLCLILFQRLRLFAIAFHRGPAVAQWLRCCAKNQKVACSIPDGVTAIFHWHNPSGRTMALGSTQPLTEMITRSISWG